MNEDNGKNYTESKTEVLQRQLRDLCDQLSSKAALVIQLEAENKRLKAELADKEKKV